MKMSCTTLVILAILGAAAHTRAFVLHTPLFTRHSGRESACTRRAALCVMQAETKTVYGYREGVLKEAASEKWLLSLEEEVKDLDRRLLLAPYEPDATVPQDQEVFLYDLLRTQGSSGDEAKRLCAALARDHYAVVRLREGDAEVMKRMWDCSRSFVDLTEDERFNVAGMMRKVGEGMVGVLGYGRMEDGNSFLEMRLDSEGRMRPEGMDVAIPRFSDGMLASRGLLTQMAKDVVSAAAIFAGIDDKGLLSLVDDGASLPHGSVTTSQHRLCHYEADTNVPFEAHTDTTFVTLIPRSDIPGLQVFTERSGWVSPDVVAVPRDVDACRDVVVMSGEFLQLLTGGVFKAAVHRVARSDPSVARISVPLLVRGRMWKKVDANELLHSTPLGLAQKPGFAMIQRLNGAEIRQLHAYLSNPPQPST